MRRLGLYFGCLLFGAAWGPAFGAAPAAPSYQSVEATVARVKGDLSKGGSAQPNAPGWNTLFDALLGDLRAYSAATTDADRLSALNRAYQISVALGVVTWSPAAEVRESLRSWLRPRVKLAWAERRLVDHLKSLPPAATDGARANRDHWVKFVNNDLGQALQKYDAASTVADRQNALKSVNAALAALQSRNQANPWAPSIDLQSALNDLYNLPNFDVSVDVATLSPAINVNLVTSGPVTRKGYVSQVTAGPKTGFGLLPSDDGILFYNKQLLTSVTPIWDFQQQVQSDPKGKRAAKLYQFGATTTDSSELTIYTAIRPTGLAIWPAYAHNANANISTAPQPGGGLGRAVAGIVGYNQPKITKMAYDNAIGKIRSNIAEEAMQEGLERTSREAAVRNAALAQYLIGGDRATFRNILIQGLSLRSRPENALIGGKVEYLNAGNQVGADAPQPPQFTRPDPGVSADVHLTSVASNFTRGVIQSDAVKNVQNVMIVTQDVPPGTPPADGVKVTQNVDFPAYLQAAQASAAANNPKVVAIRLKRPGVPPEFGVDNRGFLVALVNDFQLEVPVPPQLAKGGFAGPPARVYRIVSPQAEFVISFKVEPSSADEPLHLTGRIEGFDAGPRGQVFAINDDENQASKLNDFTARIITAGLGTKLSGQPIDVPLSNAQLRGFAIHSVSPLDPSGWIRVNLVRTSESPAAGLVAPPGAAPVNPAPSPSAETGSPTESPSPTPPSPAAPAPPPAPGPQASARVRAVR